MRFLRYLLPFFLLCSSAWGAIGSTCVWEVRTTGSNTNGGGYTSGGTDYSQQAAAQYALTGVTSAGAGNTVLSASAAADMVGNTACCVSGTNFTTSEWFEVASVSVGVSITFSTSHDSASICTGIGANGVINIGGAFKIGGTRDDEFFDASVAGNTVYLASTTGGVTYTVGESINKSGSGTTLLPITFQGYKDTRTTRPTGVDRPTIAYADYNFDIYTPSYAIWKYLIFTSSTYGIYTGSYNLFVECKATNSYPSGGMYAFVDDYAAYVKYIRCEAICRMGTAFRNAGYGHYVDCYAHDSATGFYVPYGSGTVEGCVIDTCQIGINCASSPNLVILGNTIRNCVRGIYTTGASHSSIFTNNIIADCVTGASWATNYLSNFWDYNCWSNNGTDVTNVTKGAHDVSADALLVSGTAKGTNGVTSASGLVFTSASNPFGSVTTADTLNIVETGTGATLDVYVISSVDSPGQLTLATSAGATKTGIDFCIVLGNDFTLSAGSPCFNTGLKLGADVGL